MSKALDLDDGFAGRGDDVYEALIRGHEGLSEEESAAMNARLVLILANQVRDPEAVIEAIRLARQTAREPT
jgi:anthranilate phosphoribosyltransferase